MDEIRTSVVHASLSRRPRVARVVVVGALTALSVAVLPACTSSPVARVSPPGLPKATDVALVRYSGCGQALRDLRTAVTAALGRGMLGVGYGAPSGAQPGAVAGAPGVSAPSASTPSASGSAAAPASGYYSGTNDAVAGVDEPDLIKTNGQRIVTVIGGVLRVVDAQTHQLTGSLDLRTRPGLNGASAANLMLYGDHALVLVNPYYPIMEPLVPPMSPVHPIPGATGHSQVRGVPGGRSSGPALPSGQRGMPPASPIWGPIAGPRLLLVDISTGVPKVISEYTMDGSLVDARQVGPIARVVVRSAPRLFIAPEPPVPGAGASSGGSAGAGIGAGAMTGTSVAGRTAIARADIGSWLPRYAVTDGTVHHTGLVSCADVSHPAKAGYSGASMLTVLTFDLSASSLGDGQPVTIVADGDTVYSDGASLYIVNDQQWLMPPAGMVPVGQGSAPAASGTATTGPATTGTVSAGTVSAGTATAIPAQPPTTVQPSTPLPTEASPPTEPPVPPASPLPTQYVGLYKFSIAGSGRPVYEASGTVPGWLLGSQDMTQYALSEWNGVLRVATTTGSAFFSYAYGSYDSAYSRSQSAVYELEQVGGQLVIVGKAGGLGAGEQIYAVRFAGPVGYVVTYRQVDPLYTLDLSDPAQPRVVGVLHLRGYSAYLDPIDSTHLIGVGQDANAQGETLGTQVSLFDVSDLAAPVRLAAYHLRFGHSEAEFDPHAFLYWPVSRIVVIPVTVPYTAPATGQPIMAWPASAALVLRVGDHSLTKLGMIRQPAVPGLPGGGQILRSLVIGDTLWTLSDTGLQANDLTTLASARWVPFG